MAEGRAGLSGLFTGGASGRGAPEPRVASLWLLCSPFSWCRPSCTCGAGPRPAEVEPFGPDAMLVGGAVVGLPWEALRMRFRSSGVRAAGWPATAGSTREGSRYRPFRVMPKWTWQPVELPVVPARAITSPRVTRSPGETRSTELW
ncbi:hypothetical protein ACFFX0_01030 [Citricoccus parietis]|uniref:Secreted protein n=1 Tax=Citricoccus parietis TaxID=592307 RepID=A0ABV5FT62_9MICC